MEPRSFKKKLTCFLGMLFLLVMFGTPGYAEVGVTDDTIKIGTSLDLSGPAVFYGKGYLQGMNVYFKSVNAKGGIHGRKIELIAYDDEYKPSRTVSNFKRLVYEDKVFSLCQTFGTPNTLALLPLIDQEKIPLIAPSTSAVQVAIPPQKYVFPVWPILHYYGRLMVDYAVSDSGSKSPKAVFLFFDSEFGTQQRDGAIEQAKKYGFELLDVVPYKGDTVDFTSILLRVKDKNPDYVFLASIIKDTAAILVKAKEIGWKPQFLGMTASVNQSMLKLAGDAGEYGKGYKALYACNMSDENKAGPIEFRAVMKEYAPDVAPDEITFQAYGAAKLMCEGLRRAGKDLTREGLVKALETLKDFSNGVNPPCTYGPDYRVGASAARMVKVSGGKFVALSDWIYPK